MERNKGGIIRIPKKSALLTPLVEYLWALLVVLNGNSVFHADALIEYHLLEYCVLATAVLLLIYCVTKKIRLVNKWVALSIFLAIYGVIYICVRQSSMTVLDFALLFVMGLPLLTLMFIHLHQRDRLIPLFRRITDVVCVLAAISLFFWIFGVLLEMIRPNTYRILAWGRFSWVEGYYGLHYRVQLDTTFFPMAYLYRNSGIFAEAPMLNLWLDIALAIELFLKPRPSKWRVVLLVVTVFTTMSVTGILFLMLCLLLCLIKRGGDRRIGRMGRLMLVVLVIATPLMLILILVSMSLKSDTTSYLMRLSDYAAGVRLWFDHPIFGAGYANLHSLLEYMYSPDGTLGFSNSLTAVLGTGGLWIALLFYIPLFGSMSYRWTGDRSYCKFFICYTYLFCTTAFFGRYISVVMIAFQLAMLLGKHRVVPIAVDQKEKAEHHDAER